MSTAVGTMATHRSGRAADQGAGRGSGVFDGARFINGLTPDLEPHCARAKRSAKALMLTPTVSTEDMMEIIREGLQSYDKGAAVYIRPMYWGIHGDLTAIVPDAGETGFAICHEQSSDGRPGNLRWPDAHPSPPPWTRGRGGQRQGRLPLPK